MSIPPSGRDGTESDPTAELSELLGRLKKKDGRSYRDLEAVSFWGKSDLQRRITGTTTLSRADLIRILDIFGARPDECAHALVLLELITHSRGQAPPMVDQKPDPRESGDNHTTPLTDGAGAQPSETIAHGSIREPESESEHRSTWSRWVPTLIGAVVAAGFGIGWAISVDTEPQRQCAMVITEGAAVWREIGQTPLRHKRDGDLVELHVAKGTHTIQDITYQAVLLRQEEHSFGWMRTLDLEDSPCTT